MGTDDVRVTVRLFSIAKEIAGFDTREMNVPPGAHAALILEKLTIAHPRFNAWVPSMRLAVNQEYVSGERVLQDGDEVAVIPPVSGG
jgi:molybdopterin converting factor subunit 1